MKKLIVLFFIGGLTFCANSQDDKKTPEKKLSGSSTVAADPNAEVLVPERKLVTRTTIKKQKVIKTGDGTPEKKLITK